jgi:hypothetical protein
MRHINKCFITGVFCFFVNTLLIKEITAQNGSARFISESLPQLKKISSEINQNVLPLLALIKKIEGTGTSATFKVAKIVKPQTSVKEADNANSMTIVNVKMNEEFAILEERDKWYRIKTLDNRAGWVLEEDVQIIVKQSIDVTRNLENFSKEETSALLSQISRYKGVIEELYTEAGPLIKEVDEEYGSLTTDRKKAVETDYQAFKTYKEKIEKNYGYAIRFAKPYEDILISPGAPQPSKLPPGDRFKGTVAADIGQSSYNINSESTISGRFVLDGIYQIDKNTRMNFALNHQNELIQTAFSNSVLNAGLTRQLNSKMSLGANISYDIYDDKASDNNSFGFLRAGINAVINSSRKVNVFANASYQSKDFKNSGNNDYQGIVYMAGTSLTPDSKYNIRIQVQGNIQSGEKDYLNFTQITPQFIYTHKKDKEKSFTLGLDYDILRFTLTSNYNDYRKYKTDLKWRNKINNAVLSRYLSLAYKQYPANSKQDYYRMGFIVERRTGQIVEQKSSVTSFSYLFNVMANREDNFLRDYLDLRWDRSSVRPKVYSNVNFLTRLYNNLDMAGNDTSSYPDHYIDFYGEFGPCFRNVTDGTVKIEVLKIGLVMGGHLFFNFDEDNFNRDGNSVRGGFTVSSNIKILKANLVLGGTYEWSKILCKETSYNPNTGIIVYGENLYRKPTSFQINIDYRQPIKDKWDVHFNLSTYNIRTDATYETSINPVKEKSSLRFSGGLIYRFSL